MRKKGYLALLSIFCLLGALFYNVFHETVLKWGLHIYSNKTFGQPLKYSSLSFVDGHYLIKNARLGDDFTSEEMTLQYAFDWLQREMSLNLVFERPSFRIRQKGKKEWKTWEKWQSWIKKRKSWLTIQPNVKIRGGRLLDLSEDFHFDLSFESNRRASLILYAKENPLQNYMLLEGHSQGNITALKLQCKDADAPFLNQLGQNFFPFLKEFHLAEGRLSGKIEGTFCPGTRPCFTGEIAAADLAFEHKSLQIAGSLPKGLLKIEKKDGNTQGVFLFEEPASLEHANTWELTDIQGSMAIETKKMAIQLHADGSLLGKTVALLLEGESRFSNEGTNLILQLKTPHLNSKVGDIHVSWGPGVESIKLECKGIFKDFKSFLPASVYYAENFFQELPLAIQMYAKNQDNHLEILGTIETDASPIHFGAEFKKDSAPSGWFYASQFDLERLAACTQNKVKLVGNVKVKGFFEDYLLTLFYEPEGVFIDTADFSIDATKMRSLVPSQFSGWHEINFNDGTHRGTLPFDEVAFLEKNSGLLFESLQGKVRLSNALLKIDPIEALIERVAFEGSLQFKWEDPLFKEWSLALRAPHFSGPAAGLQKILSPWVSKDIKLQGEVYGRESGLFLKVKEGLDPSFEIQLQGSLCDAEMAFPFLKLAVKGLFSDFNLNYPAKTFELSEAQASLLWGKDKEFECGSKKISVCLITGQGSGDFWVKKEGKEILHLEGVAESPAPSLISLVFSPDSHFCKLKLGITECLLKEGALEAFKFATHFNGYEPEGDMIHQVLFPYLGKQIKLEGGFQIKGSLDPLEKGFHMQVEGGPIGIGSSRFEKLNMELRKNGHRWRIDDCSLDDWQFFAAGDSFKINSMGLSLGKAFSIGLEGVIDFEKAHFEASLKHFKMDLFKIAKNHQLALPGNFGFPTGRLEGTGFFKIGNLFSLDQWCVNGEAAIQARDFGWGVFKKEGEMAAKVKLAPEGLACFMNEGESFALPLKDIILNWDFQTTRFAAYSPDPQHPFHLEGKYNGKQGELALRSPSSMDPPLKIHWHQNEQNQEKIDEVAGSFYGYHFRLKGQNGPEFSHAQALEGNVKFNLNQPLPFLPPAFHSCIQQIQWNALLELDGNFWAYLNKSAPQIYMNGTAKTKRGFCKGLMYDRMESAFSYEPNQLKLVNILLCDQAGLVECPLLELNAHKGNQWHFTMPHLAIKNFKPSHLRKENKEKVFENFKSLLVNKIDLYQMQGLIHDVKSWKGRGQLQFHNAVRKMPAHPLFTLPSEIILRLGLDPQVLNPVTGTVNYYLEGGRFILTKLKDVYSAGRGSKFYLAKGLATSWVDLLEGKLSMKIKMKQYNLVFKIAELFTFSIDGNIKKPVFAIDKGGKKFDEESK